MLSGVRFSLVLIGLFVGGIAAAIGAWYVSSGDTSSPLAALVDQTPTPKIQPTVTTKQAERKAAKQQQKQAGQGQPGADARGAFGVITALNGSTLTVKDATGTERTFTFTAKTQLIVVG